MGSITLEHSQNKRIHFVGLGGKQQCLYEVGCLIAAYNTNNLFKIHLWQECIPVGCVPAARRPYAGVCFPSRVGEGVWSGGVCLVWGGVCLVQGDVWSGGMVCQVRGGGGVPGQGGVCLVWGGLVWGGLVCLVWGGVCLVRGMGCVPGLGACAWSGGLPGLGGSASVPCGIPPPLWTEWQTGVKILSWPQLRCGR